jgi:AcrR family transcriptional regulator
VSTHETTRHRPGPNPGDFADRRRARLLEIVDISAGLFAERGFSATGVNELGEVVGLGRGALYHYIGSKASLLVEIHKRIMEPLQAALDQILAAPVSWSAKLRLASINHLTIQARMINHSRVISAEIKHLQPDELKAYERSRVLYERGWAAILEGGQAAGEFRIEDLSITRLALLGMHNYTVQWIQPRGAMSSAEISRHYCRIIMMGISPSADWEALDNEVDAAAKLLATQQQKEPREKVSSVGR